jgi:SAM-dependent methyltransferase
MPPTAADAQEVALRTSLLQDAYLQVSRVSTRPNLAVHPDDVMAQPSTLHLPPDLAGFEYLRSGCEALAVLENSLAAFGRRLEEQDAILDFASGFGRMLRFLVNRIPPQRVFASDVMPNSTLFTRESFGVQSFPSATEPGDIAFPRRFSAIWVGSLFTHLPEERFRDFLAALAGALEPDGILFFTTHAIPEDAEDGHAFVETPETYPLNEKAYGTAWTATSFIEELCGELGLRFGGSQPRDLWRIQDVNAVLGPEAPEARAWKRTPIARGGFHDPQRDGSLVRIEGHVNIPRELGPLDGVAIHVAGQMHVATLDARIEPSTPEQGGARFPTSYFMLEGDRADLPRQDLPVVAEAHFGGGKRSVFAGYVEPA